MTLLSKVVTRKQQGASYLELAIALLIIGVLITVLLARIQSVQGQAERVAVQQTVASIRTAIEMRLVERKLPGRSVDLAALAEENPFDWLNDKPRNYAGAYYAPADADIGDGNWCFDRADKSVIYLLTVRDSFLNAHRKRLKFKVKLLSLPKDAAKPPGGPKLFGVAFEQVES